MGMAELTPSAVGVNIVGTMPCPPSTGLPNGTRCNIVTSPGVDAVTFEQKMIDPAQRRTIRAQREFDENLESGKIMITAFTVGNAVNGAVMGVFCLALSIFCCRRRASSGIAKTSK